MNLKQTRLHIRGKELGKIAMTGISLHCHTQFSKEMLDFIPFYADKIPVVSYFWKREQAKYMERKGGNIDFSAAYWSPPLPEQMVYQLEKEQINKAGLDAIVSITDHDCIDANLNLCETIANEKVPISMEWTVPFENGFFHLGVHNLPKDSAREIANDLLDFTYSEKRGLQLPENRLGELLELLNTIPEVLVILNHPIWDIEMIGQHHHEMLLEHFVKENIRWIHALEINGFRSWSENKRVMAMAESLGLPLVSGGDRHGCQPNTVINLTNSATFSEFVEEIRIDKHSNVALLAEYKQPLISRQLQSCSDILSNYPEFPEGRQLWFDRLYYDIQDGNGVQKLSKHWKFGGPIWLRWVVSLIKLLGKESLHPIFQLSVNANDRVPKDEKPISSGFVVPQSDSLLHSYDS